MSDEKDIPDEDFAIVLTTVREFADDLVKKEACEQPTQFEILTAAAFHYFALQQVDYAVIEVGLGGLWDSTNLIVGLGGLWDSTNLIKPLVSVITNIALDHTKVLGNTIEEIALQKAGIIKEKVPVVTGAEGNALGPIRVMGALKEAPLYEYGRSFRFRLMAGTNYASEYEIQLPGAHQIVNASLAIVAAKIVSKQDPRITEEHLHLGAAHTKWPGRLEKISSLPDVILDGAHNPNGAEALRNALDKYYPDRKRAFVFGMMGDKSVDEVIRILFRSSDTVFTVRADEGPRAAEAADLAARVGSNATAVDSVSRAYRQACEAAGDDGVVCVCGSLYLVGTFKASVRI